jgi:hypothetical protein
VIGYLSLTNRHTHIPCSYPSTCSALFSFSCAGVVIKNNQIYLNCYLQSPPQGNDRDTTASFTPIELSTLVLRYLKRSAEAYLQRKPISPLLPNHAEPALPSGISTPKQTSQFSVLNIHYIICCTTTIPITLPSSVIAMHTFLQNTNIMLSNSFHCALSLCSLSQTCMHEPYMPPPPSPSVQSSPGWCWGFLSTSALSAAKP